jgi:hypothetical protein
MGEVCWHLIIAISPGFRVETSTYST